MHIDVDSSGNIYVTGQTNSTDFVTANPYQATSGGLTDVFVTKLSAMGALQYSTYLGGKDGNGAAYLTGQVGSDDFPTTPGVVQPDRHSGAGLDAIVTKMTAGGDLAFSTFFNQTGTEEGIDLAIDGAGNSYLYITLFEDEMGHKTAYIVGTSESTDFPTVDPLQGTLNGQIDTVIVVINELETIRANFIYLPAVRNVKQ